MVAICTELMAISIIMQSRAGVRRIFCPLRIKYPPGYLVLGRIIRPDGPRMNCPPQEKTVTPTIHHVLAVNHVLASFLWPVASRSWPWCWHTKTTKTQYLLFKKYNSDASKNQRRIIRRRAKEHFKVKNGRLFYTELAKLKLSVNGDW